MSAHVMVRELEKAGLRPKRHSISLWLAKCPLCWSPDEPYRRPVFVRERSGEVDVACWNLDCVAFDDDSPLWLALAERIGVDGLRRGLWRPKAVTA